MTLKVCVVTGSRAEYGYLYWPMRHIQESASLELQLLVTGMHLSPQFGETWRDIVKDGFYIDGRIDTYQTRDDAVSTSIAMARGLKGFAAAIDKLRPDILLVFGDRFDILPAVAAALVAAVPVAHLAGGDTSEGAFDESIRHAITKMSHLHFATNALSKTRVCQMGEDPGNVHLVGSTGLDYIERMKFLNRETFFSELGLRIGVKNLIVTMHPTTLGEVDSRYEVTALIDALETLGGDVGIIVTGSNSDPGGKTMSALLQDFAARHENVVYRESLGQRLYLNALRHSDVCVGNSSSGLYEAPSFGIPTVNIGDRQKGRLRSESIIDCYPNLGSIRNALDTALESDFKDVVSPYGDGRASERIIGILEAIDDPNGLLKKHFHKA